MSAPLAGHGRRIAAVLLDRLCATRVVLAGRRAAETAPAADRDVDADLWAASP